MSAPERQLQLFLRVIGFVAFLAIGAVVMPWSWMNEIHGALGMGELPREPIVGYLARSTSAFYAMYGGLAWIVAADLKRYRPVVNYLGIATIVLGIALVGIDFAEGMPWWWSGGEGPLDLAFGVAILALNARAVAARAHDSGARG